MTRRSTKRRLRLSALFVVIALTVPVAAYSHEWTDRPVEELVKLAREGDRGARGHAVVALGKIGGPVAKQTLIAALADPEWDIRSRAAEGLGRIGDPGVIPNLLVRLRTEVELEPAFMASAEAPKYFSSVPVPHFVQGRIGTAIGQILATHAKTAEGEEAKQEVVKVMLDPSEKLRVRGTIAIQLGLLGDRRSIPVLIDALQHDPSGTQRSAAARMLGKLKAQEARPALIAALQDPYLSKDVKPTHIVQYDAAWALEQLDKP